MEYISVTKMAEKWGISERSVRNYCATGRISGAKLIGKTWYIPENAQKPDRINKKNDTPTLLQILREQKAVKMTGGIYHKIQIDLTYNSNHIEDARKLKYRKRYTPKSLPYFCGNHGQRHKQSHSKSDANDKRKSRMELTRGGQRKQNSHYGQKAVQYQTKCKMGGIL